MLRFDYHVGPWEETQNENGCRIFSRRGPSWFKHALFCNDEIAYVTYCPNSMPPINFGAYAPPYGTTEDTGHGWGAPCKANEEEELKRIRNEVDSSLRSFGWKL